MIDTHCHLDEFQDYVEVIDRAKRVGVTAVIACGNGVESSRALIRIAHEVPGVYAAVGAGYDYGTYSVELYSQLQKLLHDTRVVAVGECGLDYWPDIHKDHWTGQEKLFDVHIQLAQETRLPLIVHCRNAFEQVYEMVRSKPVIGMLHCFTGNEMWMRKFVDLGWYISFGGIVTFKKSHELRDVLQHTPQERILLETDSPYLAPEPVRSSRNEPKNVMIVAETIALLRGQTVEEIGHFTLENARRLFRI